MVVHTQVYVTPDQDGCCQPAATRVIALVKASIDNTNRSEALLQNICKLKASDLFPSDELGQAPAKGWLLIVSQTGHIAFVRPTPDFVKYSRRSRPNAHHFAQCERLGGQKAMVRSKKSHDAVADTVPQYVGIHYFFGRVCRWKGQDSVEAVAWRSTQTKRAQRQEELFGVLLPLAFFCMRRASKATGVEETGKVLTSQLIVGGFVAQDHVDNDLALYTLCSTFDVGQVSGGFQFGGWYVPLASGHVFAFDARVKHCMCGDHVEGEGMRWSTASFLPTKWVNSHTKGCLCRGCTSGC